MEKPWDDGLSFLLGFQLFIMIPKQTKCVLTAGISVLQCLSHKSERSVQETQDLTLFCLIFLRILDKNTRWKISLLEQWHQVMCRDQNSSVSSVTSCFNQIVLAKTSRFPMLLRSLMAAVKNIISELYILSCFHSNLAAWGEKAS